MSGSNATSFLVQRWGEGSSEFYRDRMRAVWDSQNRAQGKAMRYSVYFNARLAAYGEVLMAIGSFPLSDFKQKCEWPESRDAARCGLAFTADHQTFSNVLAALKSCQVTGLNTYQNEIGRERP